MRNNLILLGQWDAVGGCYTGENHKIILTTKTGTQIGHGTKIKNHLYKMDVTILTSPNVDRSCVHQTLVGNYMPLSLEMWHCHFGHVGYTSLQKLLDNLLVEGFNVDLWTLKPDGVACTKAKQHIRDPFTANQPNLNPF